MARKVLVRLVDDLDGMPSDDVGTVTFSLDRVTYQIDLNAANASKLRDGLAEFIAAARRTGGRVKRGAGARAGGAGNDGPAIREWARAQGHQLAERGRIPSHIVDAFRASGGRVKATATADVTAAKPTRTARKAAAAPTGGATAKTAAASRTATKATAKTTTKAEPKTASKSGTAKTTKARAATPDKAAKSTKASNGKAAAKTPRATASTAARGQRARRGPAAKSR